MSLQSMLKTLGLIMPKQKITAAQKREEKSRYEKHYSAPRSMTQQELEYYKIHRNLAGFKSN